MEGWYSLTPACCLPSPDSCSRTGPCRLVCVRPTAPCPEATACRCTTSAISCPPPTCRAPGCPCCSTWWRPTRRRPARRPRCGASSPTPNSSSGRLVALARRRLAPLADGDEAFWRAEVPFFDVRRERIWVFWRRVLHTAHHRAQVGVALRLLEDRVPPTYGPTADVSWTGADPTTTLDAARRRGA
jgi:hypothetical protein